MRYPIISESKLKNLVDLRLTGKHFGLDSNVQWIGTGEHLDLVAIEQLAQRINGKNFAEGRRVTDKDVIEGEIAIELYSALSHVPPYVLDDPGFWRYLGFGLFWDFILWREDKAANSEKIRVYIDARSYTETVLTRMYLRVQSLGPDPTNWKLSSKIHSAVDFWRSHIVRVRTGSIPVLAIEVVKKQVESRLKTEKIRPAAKMVNRMHANIIFDIYTETEVRNVVDDVWRQVDEK